MNIKVNRPDLYAELDVDLNDPAVIESGKISENKSYYWRCPVNPNHKYKMKYLTREKYKDSNPCLCCRGLQSVPGENDIKTLYPEVALDWDYSKNEFGPEEYTARSNIKVNWKCHNCGYEYTKSIEQKVKHPECPLETGKKIITGKNDLASAFKDIALEWDSSNAEQPDTVFMYSSKNVFWKCHKCGHEWKARVSDRTRNGYGCPACSGYKIQPGINDLATKFPDIASEWDNKSNGMLSPNEISPINRNKIYWKCSKCGNIWNATPYRRTVENATCPFCDDRRNNFKKMFPDIAKNWDYVKNKKDPSEYTHNSVATVWWICPHCGKSYSATIYSRTHNQLCPDCSKNTTYKGIYV